MVARRREVDNGPVRQLRLLNHLVRAQKQELHASQLERLRRLETDERPWFADPWSRLRSAF